MSSQACILVEGREEIEQAEALRAARFPEGVIYVSLSSQAKYELMTRNLPHVNGYEYCDLDELYRVTDAQYDDLRRQCFDLDRFLQSQIPELEKYDIQPFFFNYYQAKIVLDTIRQRTLMVQGAHGTFGDRLYAFAPSVEGWSRFLKTADRITGFIFEAISDKAHMLPRNGAPHHFSLQETAADAHIAQELQRHRSAPVQLCVRVLNKVRKKIAGLGAGKVIWSLSPVIPDDSLRAAGLRRKKPEVSGQGHVAVPDVGSAVFSQGAFTEMVNYAGSASRPMLEGWFNAHVLGSLSGYIALAQQIEDAITRDAPVLLESGSYFSPEDQLMATQFARHGKKVVGANHGSLGLQKEKMFGVCDLQYASDYFVWGSGVKDYITNQHPFPLPDKLNVHVSGTKHFETDVVLDRAALCRLLGIAENKTIVLMPGAAFRHNIFYNWYTLMNEQEEYDNQLKLIDFFAERGDCVFIYKGLANADYDESHISAYMAARNNDNLIYMNKTPLRYLLPAIDVFMTDRPSTSILEAMGCEKICYSYNRWITFPGNSADLYNEAAQHFLTPESMLDKFAADIEAKFSNVPRSLDYYKAYGNATTAGQRQAIFTDFLSHLNS